MKERTREFIGLPKPLSERSDAELFEDISNAHRNRSKEAWGIVISILIWVFLGWLVKINLFVKPEDITAPKPTATAMLSFWWIYVVMFIVVPLRELVGLLKKRPEEELLRRLYLKLQNGEVKAKNS